MAETSRRLRGLAYSLADVEIALRVAGRSASAQGVGVVARRFESLASDEFDGLLEECRAALEAVLLGERDLQVEIIGLILDVLAGVDDVLREVYDKH